MKLIHKFESENELDDLIETGKLLVDEIAIGCKVHRIRSFIRVSRLSAVVPQTDKFRSHWVSMNFRLQYDFLH